MLPSEDDELLNWEKIDYRRRRIGLGLRGGRRQRLIDEIEKKRGEVKRVGWVRTFGWRMVGGLRLVVLILEASKWTSRTKEIWVIGRDERELDLSPLCLLPLSKPLPIIDNNTLDQHYSLSVSQIILNILNRRLLSLTQLSSIITLSVHRSNRSKSSFFTFVFFIILTLTLAWIEHRSSVESLPSLQQPNSKVTLSPFRMPTPSWPIADWEIRSLSTECVWPWPSGVNKRVGLKLDWRMKLYREQI